MGYPCLKHPLFYKTLYPEVTIDLLETADKYTGVSLTPSAQPPQYELLTQLEYNMETKKLTQGQSEDRTHTRTCACMCVCECSSMQLTAVQS